MDMTQALSVAGVGEMNLPESRCFEFNVGWFEQKTFGAAHSDTFIAIFRR